MSFGNSKADSKPLFSYVSPITLNYVIKSCMLFDVIFPLNSLFGKLRSYYEKNAFICLGRLKIRLELGLGKLRYRTGGPGGLPPGSGFGLAKLQYRRGVREACPLG